MPVWVVRVEPEAQDAQETAYVCGNCAVEAYRHNPFAKPPREEDYWSGPVQDCPHDPRPA